MRIISIRRASVFCYGLCLALGALGTGCMTDGSTGEDSGPAATQPAVVAAAQTGLKVQDRSHDNENPDNTLYALYRLVNGSTSAVPLTSVTMRYWFTNQTPA